MRARILTLMEILSVLALLGTQEVSWTIGVVWGALWILKTLFSIRLGDKVFALVLGVSTAAVVGYLAFQNIPPLVKAGMFVPFLQSMLWFNRHKDNQEALRLSLSLMCLLVAAAITPAFYLFFVIVCFMFLASMFLAMKHFEQSVRQSVQSFPKGYMLHTAVFSFFVLALTALIFPLIPKGGAFTPIHGQKTQVSYTETVDLRSWQRPDGDGQGEVVVRVFYQDDLDVIMKSLYFGLFRTRVLDHFDGTQWKPAFREREVIKATHEHVAKWNRKIGLEILREDIPSDRLPVPYGTTGVWTESDSGFSGVVRNLKSEWEVPSSTNRRVKYHLILSPNDIRAQYENEDTPHKLNTELPASVKNGKLSRLAENVFSRAKTSDEKIIALRHFFNSEGFQAYDARVPVESQSNLKLDDMNVIERFVFFEKKGHCELFSSAGAVLLRLAGVPTRLVSGFRVSRAGLGGVINIRTGDAHAWLEAWTTRGWVVLDLTPRIVSETGLFSRVEALYELLGSYWAGYVIGDSKGLVARLIQRVKEITWKEEGESFFHWLGIVLEENLWVLAGVLVLLIIGFFLVFAAIKRFFPHIFSIHYRVRQGPRALRTRRNRFDQWAKHSSAELGSRWLSEYERLRFGGKKPTPSREELARLDEIFKSLKSA